MNPLRGCLEKSGVAVVHPDDELFGDVGGIGSVEHPAIEDLRDHLLFPTDLDVIRQLDVAA